jgi:uncharacterized protein (DUF885 family)
MPATIAAAEQGELKEAGRRAITDEYQPALRRVKAFIEIEYKLKAPAIVGLAALPGGSPYYEFLIRQNVIRGYSAEQIHQVGLAEVKRLRERIGAIAKKVGYAGTTDEFIRELRTDPKYFFKSADEVLATYRAMPGRVDPYLPKLFHEVPRTAYAVRAMTPAEAASSTAANYTAGSLELGTPGYFSSSTRRFRATTCRSRAPPK